MSCTPYSIVVGVGELYLAPVGTAYPDTDEVPSASWTHLGSTDDGGVSVLHARSTTLHYKGNSALPQKATLDEARETISANLTEITPARYALILDGQTVITAAATAGHPGTQRFTIRPNSGCAPQFALLVRGPSPLSDAYAQYEYPRVSPVGDTTPVYSKKATVLPVKFEAFEDVLTPGQFGVYRAQETIALP